MIEIAASLRFGIGASGNAWLRRGWSNPEEDFVWAVGPHSSLTLSLLPTDGRVFIEIDLQPFVYPPVLMSRQVDVAVNGKVLARETLAVRGVLRVEVPVSLRQTPGLLVELHHPQAQTPAELGLGDDARRLAIQLHGVKLVTSEARDNLPAPAGPAMLESCFRFGGNTKTAAMLGEGWGAPEADYVWSVERRSTLRLPIAGDGERTLVLDIRPYIDHAVARQRIAVGADGHLLGFISAAQRIAVAFTLPQSAQRAKFVELSFDNIDAAKPRDSGLYADGRPFVFMLLRVRVLRRAPAKAKRRARAHGGMGPAARDLVAGFESLGSMCEMGLLQRRLGHEPVGLLRFAGITTPHLVDGIFEGFWGLGRPDTLIAESRAAAEHTYFVVDDHYALSMQTSISSRRVSIAQLKQQLSRHLPFLVRKFFEDLVAAERIFVFQRRDETIRPEADAVLAALSVWGDATLLWVQEDAVRAGDVERITPRLIKGFVDGSDESWLSVLRKARKEAVLF
jgi:hypothetical protein